MTTPPDTASTARRQIHLETLETIAETVRFALADLRAEQRQRAAGGEAGAIKNPGAWLTTKLMAMAEERGIRITRHAGETRRP